MIKVAVLYLALWCNNVHFEITRARGIVRICVASVVGTILEIAGLLLGNSYHVFTICVHLFEVPLMVWFVLRKQRRRMMWVIVAGYFFIMLINGVLEVLWNQFGQSGSYVFYLLFSCGVVGVGGRMYRNYTKMQKGIFQVEILHQGKRVLMNGFYDSGNRLKDPYTGKGVHIVSMRVLSELEIKQNVKETHTKELTKQHQNTPVYVPYQALGNEGGMLEVYYIDELIVEGEKGRVRLQKSPFGVTKDNLFEEKNYEIILNEEVF